MSAVKEASPAIQLPSDAVLVGPADRRHGPLQVVPLERIGRGISGMRTACGLPIQPEWAIQQNGDHNVLCRDCLHKITARSEA